MVDKLIKYPVLEFVFSILWLYPFENFVNTFLMTASEKISIFCLLFPSQFTQNYSEFYLENGRAVGITSVLIAYPIFFIIKIIILVFVILVIRKIKVKYADKT